MSSQPIKFDPKSMDEATHKLIIAGHRCEPLPDVSDLIPYANFVEMWTELATNHANRPWMTYYPCVADDESPAAEFTFGGFADLIDRVAGLLQSRYGIRPGGSVATLTINQPLTVAIYFAAWRLGARVVPVNPSESDDRVGYIVGNSEATVLIAHASVRENFSAVEKAIGPGVRRAIILDGATRPDAADAGWEDFSAALDAYDGGANLPRPADVDPHGDALVVYTSGTTGNPKGVVLTQHQMLCDAYAISRWHDIDDRTVLMNVLPIHHVNGTVVTLLTPAFVGAHVIVNKRFKSGGFWKKLARHNVAIVSVVPTLLQFLIEADEEFIAEDLPGFRHFICGAGPLSVELARDFQDKFGLRIVHGYGLSETVCYSCFLPIDLEWEDHTHWMYDHGFPSIGCPIDTNEMAIHDENGQSVAEGQKGEIVIRGHNVMSCYFHNPEANASAFKYGWFRSGDEGFLLHGPGDRQYFFITGRIKELIIRGGINLSPFEIDEVLMSMPGIRVGLAVGFDNRYWGEEVGAYVQVEKGAKLTEAEVIAYCRQQLPWPKVPKVVIFGDDIPVTSTGKYQRGRLKPLYEAYKDRQFKE
ncbi:MAG: long-chain fatty acid--CoA ligase [Planctomycetota bacterium]|nr:MAG: long-chain fatty acid--CoA ligase [Planctomycetota bacterium]